MSINIHPIELGVSCCYVIQARGTILIDGGAPKQAGNFMKGLQTLSLKPEDIQLIVITHGHWDHIGSAKEIKEIRGQNRLTPKGKGLA